MSLADELIEEAREVVRRYRIRYLLCRPNGKPPLEMDRACLKLDESDGSGKTYFFTLNEKVLSVQRILMSCSGSSGTDYYFALILSNDETKESV